MDWDDVDLFFLWRTSRYGKSEFVREKKVVAICSAPSILAELGLLNGKMGTHHSDYVVQMLGAILTGERIAIDGNIITEQGLGASFVFVFELLQ